MDGGLASIIRQIDPRIGRIRCSLDQSVHHAAYLDDLVIYSNTWAEHVEHLESSSIMARLEIFAVVFVALFCGNTSLLLS